MYRKYFVFLKCAMQGGQKVDVLLIAFLYLWLKVWEGIDKYWIVPVRKLFYFYHWLRIIWLKFCSIFPCKGSINQWSHITYSNLTPIPDHRVEVLLVENGEYLTELSSNTAASTIDSLKIIVKRGYISPVKIHFVT